MDHYGYNFDELYWKVLCDLVTAEEVYIGRTATKTRETRGAVLRLYTPSHNVLTARPGLNYAFNVAEWLWMVTGRNDVRTVAYFNSRIAGFSDDGLTFRGAYGPAIAQQLPWVIDELARDDSTRQAVMSIWERRPAPSKDTPCTMQFQFFVRDDMLEMIAYMRSNDVWLGLPYDLFNFTQIQRQVAAAVSDRLGRPISPGLYTHMVGSLHLYEQNQEAAEEAVHIAYAPRTPMLSSPKPVWPVPLEMQTVLNQAACGVMPETYGMDPVWKPYANLLAYYVSRKEDHLPPFTNLCPRPWRDLYVERDNASKG